MKLREVLADTTIKLSRSGIEGAARDARILTAYALGTPISELSLKADEIVSDQINSELEKAWRVSDFIELGEIMIRDAADRKESCGAHFREEYQTDDGEALRNDEDFSYVSSWEYAGDDTPPNLHKENLEFDTVTPTQRSYK